MKTLKTLGMVAFMAAMVVPLAIVVVVAKHLRPEPAFWTGHWR